MRRMWFIFALGMLSGSSAFAADADVTPPPIACGNHLVGGINCIVTKEDLKEARAAHARGLKLQEQKKLEEAYGQFDEAASLAPQNQEYLRTRELVKAQLVFDHVKLGNELLSENSRARAAAEFSAAVELDSADQFARERLEEATRPLAAERPQPLFDRQPESAAIQLAPSEARATFHFLGDARTLFEQLGEAYGIGIQVDDTVTSKPITFNVDNVDFFSALKLACQVTKMMWAPLDAHHLILLEDRQENHRQLDRMALQTFQMPPHSSPQDITEFSNTLRTIFDTKYVAVGQTADKIEVRAPQAVLEACAKLMAQLHAPRPQVMLDVRVFQISHTLTRDIGLHIPDTFNMYNIPVAALAGLAGQNIQQLINQLIASGGINQAGNTALSGLLAQLGGQQNSIFSQPLATFGAGLGFSGVSLDQFVAQLSLNESWARSLEHVTMRASQGNEASFHLGSRYPVLNASFAPIFNSPQISQAIGNQSFVPPFPSVSYEDLGLQVKTTPMVHGDNSVSLKIDLQVRSLSGQSANGVPVISNKEYQGSINLGDGEPAVVAGEVSTTDQMSMGGIPAFALLPGINQIATTNTKEHDSDELMIVITPHIVANIERKPPEIWMSQN